MAIHVCLGRSYLLALSTMRSVTVVGLWSPPILFACYSNLMHTIVLQCFVIAFDGEVLNGHWFHPLARGCRV
jgi:hypothetical protein